jgi:mannosyltransferase OCH1-like enzyme
MDSWKKHLPDYEFMWWNFERFDKNSSLWVKQAFESKKYAFAADYIRLHALYNYGGIYLDTDVEVLKSFDDLLDLPYFIGKEYSNDDCHIASKKRVPIPAPCHSGITTIRVAR